MEALNEKSIQTVIDIGEAAIVLFYADWCPYCRRFKPTFESYERKFNANFAEALVNEDANPLWDKFKIEYIPTVIAFKDGEQVGRIDAVAGQGLDETDLKKLLVKLEKRSFFLV
ncbi:MAG: thioredoxin family protein [Candidatus Micrarchaeota archaeon]|nr:thioredoxin family protein [Candidatus Micrarchaeota archaeon]